MENLSSLEKKHNEQAEKLQKEIKTLQIEREGLLTYDFLTVFLPKIALFPIYIHLL